jgi:Alpha/beta hydrolase domain
MRVLIALAIVLLGWMRSVGAEVGRVVVESREDVLGGAPFGAAGPYEKIVGTIHLVFDPAHPANRRVVDLALAPRNAGGRVEASTSFVALRPKHPRGDGEVLLLEVVNRGGKAALAYFNRAAWSRDPRGPAEFGDGLLMRLGLTVLWVGWQFDVPPHPGLLRLDAPRATAGDRPIEGLVRSDWTVDRPTRTLPLAHRGHVAYPVADPASPDSVLTVRTGRLAPRTVVPRSRWRFARDMGGDVVEDTTHLHMPGGFEAGRIYELVYRARDPVVVGLGLATIRDVASHAKHDPRSPWAARWTIALGISQTGRFLRHFLYQGFNTDEAGRPVFDGMLIHTAGAGRESFNHRFAQPSRDAHRYSTFFYPTDLFPFTGRAQVDPETAVTDGLLERTRDRKHLPKIMFTNTGYEYWGRAASLIHTTVDGRADMEPLPEERVYHLASAQHFVGEFPPHPGDQLVGTAAYRGNPLDFITTLRALLVDLVDWVVAGRQPPASAYPRIDRSTLVPVDRLRFPRIPGVTAPKVIHEAHRVDYGPRWAEGLITLEPPRVGAAFPSRVSQVDALGNEMAGLQGVELLAPLATYAPWSLRGGYPAATDELVDFLGTYVPLRRTEAERERTGDPRPSIERLYPDGAAYRAAVRRAAESLRSARVLLDEDVAHVLDRAQQHWNSIMSR